MSETKLIPPTDMRSDRLVYLRDLLLIMVQREIKLRYKRSILGVAWSLLNPLAQLLVFHFVFSRLLPLNIPDYASFLFSGLLVWNWFQTALYASTGAIVDNRELVRRPGFPVAVLPVVSVATNFVHFLLALPILFAFLILNGIAINGTYAFLLVLFVVQFLFTLSLAYILATLHVTFRDTQYLLNIALMLGFYVTPIFYAIDSIPESLRLIYQLNPMMILIQAYRMIFLGSQLPDLIPLIGLTVFSIVLLIAGYFFFQRASDQFAEEL